MKQTQVEIRTDGNGLYLVSDAIRKQMAQAFGVLPEVAMLNVFIVHTSASLVIQENASPSAQSDLETFINRLAPQNQNWHLHVDEGPDDTTSHLKSAITQTSLMIPITKGRLGLGTWQGIYVWEHRDIPHQRRLILTLLE